MRLPTLLSGLVSCLLASSVLVTAETAPLASHQILPSTFKPPQVFKNVNLLRTINLEKGFVRETINVIIENIGSAPQTEYFIPFKANAISNVGGLEVRDKKDPSIDGFRTELVEYDPYGSTQFYRVTLPTPLAKASQQTLSITYHVVSALTPLPAKIEQQDKQHLRYPFSTYAASAYETDKQKTKLKFPSVSIPDYTGSPDRQGTTFTYGPYESIPAGAEEEASVRYELTKPIIHASLLERDVEISHWGGNIAFEERYWLTNNGAHLSNQFSRVKWAMSQHYPTDSSALKEIRMPLKVGSVDPYFTDDIGNVSTSHFRSNSKEAMLELKPRYPVFGGWKYSFRVGWNNNLKSFLRKVGATNGYVLKVPFLEGPKMAEGMSYEKIVLTIILPEGAVNVQYDSPLPVLLSETSYHRTFMDTVGRTSLKLTVMNVVDQSRDQDIIVTYDYSFLAIFRKPLTIFAGIMTVFITAWAIGSLDVSIGKKS